jgi:hypothetical protein
VPARNRTRAIGFAAAALLLGAAVIACGPGPAPTASPSYSPSATSSPASPGVSLGGVDTASPLPSATDSASAPASGSAAPATPDPVASELDQINQLINDLNKSISDSSQQGGE